MVNNSQRVVLALILVVFLPSCGDAIGTSCSIRGSGFSASDECRYDCVDRRPIMCPGGVIEAPKICSGSRGCEPGDCPDGQVCDQKSGQRSYCVLNDICGNLTSSQLAAWENERYQWALEQRARSRESARRKPKKPTPTVVHPPLEKPAAPTLDNKN